LEACVGKHCAARAHGGFDQRIGRPPFGLVFLSSCVPVVPKRRKTNHQQSPAPTGQHDNSPALQPGVTQELATESRRWQSFTMLLSLKPGNFETSETSFNRQSKIDHHQSATALWPLDGASGRHS